MTSSGNSNTEGKSAFGYRVDKKLIDVLQESVFTLSAEIIPPRNGTEISELMQQIEKLIHSGAQFLAVTKGAGGSLRAGSLPIAQLIKEQFHTPCIAHFTCRDLTPQEVENQLMDHHYFGVRNVLGLRGDPPVDQKDWSPKDGTYPYAHLLIDQISKLNRGEFLVRKSDGRAQTRQTEITDFCIGAACYPEAPTQEERIQYFEKKIQAGATYGITQMLFDSEIYSEFLNELNAAGVQVPILPGTRVLKTKTQARKMAERFNVRIPQWWMDALPENASDPGASTAALNAFLRFCCELREAGAPGVHVFVLTDIEISCLALEQLRSLRLRKSSQHPPHHAGVAK